MRRFLAFAGDCVLVAHNARFDMSFLDRAVERMESRRLAAPVLDTVPLARALLNGRAGRTSLASLSRFFGTSVQPCHRALADAQATAEILVALIGMAQERGAATVADLQRLAAPRARQAHDKRSLAFGAPTRPGVYLFHGPGDQVLYVGRARNLRRGFAPTSAPSGSARRSRPRSPRSSGSSGACSAPRSRRRSTSCG